MSLCALIGIGQKIEKLTVKRLRQIPTSRSPVTEFFYLRLVVLHPSAAIVHLSSSNLTPPTSNLRPQTAAGASLQPLACENSVRKKRSEFHRAPTSDFRT